MATTQHASFSPLQISTGLPAEEYRGVLPAGGAVTSYGAGNASVSPRGWITVAAARVAMTEPGAQAMFSIGIGGLSIMAVRAPNNAVALYYGPSDATQRWAGPLLLPDYDCRTWGPDGSVFMQVWPQEGIVQIVVPMTPGIAYCVPGLPATITPGTLASMVLEFWCALLLVTKFPDLLVECRQAAHRIGRTSLVSNGARACCGQAWLAEVANLEDIAVCSSPICDLGDSPFVDTWEPRALEAITL